jgi:threonine dehydratase
VVGADLAGALERVRRIIRPSPVLRAPDLSERLGRETFLKLESLLETGSFKVRGAAACMLGLEPSRQRRGVVTCSSGNHGRAVAYVAERLGIPATVCVPDWVDPVKLRAIRGHGAETLLAGGSYDQAEEVALTLSRDRGLTFVPPFDHPDVVAGQGTLALELLDQVPEVAEVVAPLSGGGLVGGIAAALAWKAPHVEVTAVTAWNARVMWESLQAGRPIELEEEETVAGALAGGIGLDNRVTFPLIRDRITRHRIVHEPAIRAAMAYGYRELGLVLEGGGAVALAAALEGLLDTEPPDQSGALVVVLSGGNVATDVLRSVLGG